MRVSRQVKVVERDENKLRKNGKRIGDSAREYCRRRQGLSQPEQIQRFERWRECQNAIKMTTILAEND